MQKRKNNISFNIESCPYARFDFPDKEDDPICRICFKPCSENSSCSDRYHQVQGMYVERNPEKREKVEEEPDTFQICDKCYDLTDVKMRTSIFQSWDAILMSILFTG